MSQAIAEPRQKHRRRDEAHRGDWKFCPWCGEALLVLGVCRICSGPAREWTTQCINCSHPPLATKALEGHSLSEVAALYRLGLSWGEIGKRLAISTPRKRSQDVRYAVLLWFEVAGSPGAAPFPDTGDESARQTWREHHDRALSLWLREQA